MRPPDGTGFDLVRPGRSYVRVCGTRPCDAVNVYEPNGSDWRLVKSITITDDPVNGIFSTPEGVIRYDPDTGRRLPYDCDKQAYSPLPRLSWPPVTLP